MPIQLQDAYVLPIAVALGMNLQCAFFAFRVVAMRKKIFNKQFMEKQFGQIHKKQLNENIPPLGNPDTGSGVYSQKLSYKDWYEFNYAQRTHLNYVQTINFAVTSLLAAGLFKPIQAAISGLVFIISRFFFAFFVKRQHGAVNRGRVIAAAVGMISILVNVGIFGYKFYKCLNF